MLVLTREKNEKIYIGDDISIMVVNVKGGRVRIGITAPKSIAVDRAEIREAKNASDSSGVRSSINRENRNTRTQNLAGCAKVSSGKRRESSERGSS